MGNISSTELSKIAQKLDASGVPWGIFAGAAALIYGSTRSLKDIDILIPSDAGDSVSRYFPSADLELCDDQRILSIYLPDFEIFAGLTKGIRLEMDTEMISRISRHELLGVTVSVLSVEDNIVFKAALGRDPKVGKRDWGDIAAMLKANENLDWVYLYWRLEKCKCENTTTIISRLNEFR